MQCLELAVPNFDGAFIFICGVISVRNGLVCVFVKKLLFYRATNFNVNKVRMQKFHCILFFLNLRFVLQSLTIHGTAGKGGRQSLFYFTISTWLRTLIN